jgi:3',5'-cyclic-AMP phosphodiesterase
VRGGHLCGRVHRDVSALFAGTLMTAAPGTCRLSALRLHDAGPPGCVAEPASFLLHVLDATGCVTRSVASSHAAAFIAF